MGAVVICKNPFGVVKLLIELTRNMAMPTENLSKNELNGSEKQ